MRLPFGVASAPAIFQRAMDTILQGLPGVICYLDDILITGESDRTHLKNLQAVLGRLREHGVHLKRYKCQFFQESVDYLGHVLSKDGVHTSPQKVKAIVNQPIPRNDTALLFPWASKLLQQVYTGIVLSPSHSTQPPLCWPTVAMDRGLRPSI